MKDSICWIFIESEHKEDWTQHSSVSRQQVHPIMSSLINNIWGYLKVVSYFLVSSFSSLSISFPARMTGTRNVFQLQTARPLLSYLCMRWSFHSQDRLCPTAAAVRHWKVQIPSLGFGLQEPSHSSDFSYEMLTQILISAQQSGYFTDKDVSRVNACQFSVWIDPLPVRWFWAMASAGMLTTGHVALRHVPPGFDILQPSSA